MEKLKNADMGRYTSFRTGGCADLLVTVEDIDELKEVLREIVDNEEEYFFLGNGTNTLVTDEGYHGTVIKMGEPFSKIEFDGCYVTVGAATLLPRLAKLAMQHGLSGFENISGIPGSVGGAVCMNAGAFGSEIRDVLEEVVLLSKDGSKMETVKAEDLDLSYRHSRLFDTEEIVVSAKFKLEKADPESLSARMKEIGSIRKEKQPLGRPNAGSFFKRKEGYFAAKLIQDSDLKGVRIGGAEVSKKHSGFIVNCGGATAKDIIDLMHLVQNVVYDRFQVELEPEVRIIGGCHE